MKASSLCAASAFFVLGGFMTVNLAGCGGGGGGGGGLGQATPTPSVRTVTLRLQLQNGNPSNTGTVVISGPVSTTVQADAQGLATVPALPPGTYTVRFTVVDENGTELSTTTNTIIVTRASNQNFLLIQDNDTSSTLRVQGVVRLNPVVGDPDSDITTANCTNSSSPVTGPFLVSVIDLDTSKGQPIIAQLRRTAQPSNTTAQNRGLFNIGIPYRPRVFRVQITQYDLSGAQYAGLSASTNFPQDTSNPSAVVTGVNVCVNQNGVAPRPAPTLSPTFTPTPGLTFIPTGTPTATPVPPTNPTGF
jgi:hypothetical protein